MYFFKFQSPDKLEFNMLRRGEIFFASVDELNDASECRPRLVLKGSADLWRRLAGLILERIVFAPPLGDWVDDSSIKTILRLGSPLGESLKKRAGRRDFGIERLGVTVAELLELQLGDTDLASHARWIAQLARRFADTQLIQMARDTRHIASFSKNLTNATMWGHYARAEKGFAIIYSTSDGKIGVHAPTHVLWGSRPTDQPGRREIGIYKEDRLELVPVKYGRRPPKVNAFHELITKFSYSEIEDHYDVPLLLPAEAPGKQESLIGLVKFSDWRYEDEIRCFLPVYHEMPSVMRVLRVSRADIAGLVFGPRMTHDDKVRAVLSCYQMNEAFPLDSHAEPRLPFTFFQATQVLDRFDFEVTPAGILGDHYSKRLLPFKPLDRLEDDVKTDLREMASQMVKGVASM